MVIFKLNREQPETLSEWLTSTISSLRGNRSGAEVCVELELDADVAHEAAPSELQHSVRRLLHQLLDEHPQRMQISIAAYRTATMTEIEIADEDATTVARTAPVLRASPRRGSTGHAICTLLPQGGRAWIFRTYDQKLQRQVA